MRLSRKADYALRAVRFLSTLPKGVSGSIHTIAEAESLPPQFLAKILKALARSGILVSYQGVNGGYQLARTAREISFLDIVEAMDGPVHLNLCTEGPDCGCSQDGKCQFRIFWLARETTLKKAMQRQNYGHYSPGKK